MHSVKRIYLRQWCFDASKPRVAASTGPQYHTLMGFSWRDKIPRCRVAVQQCICYTMGERNPVPASGLWPDRAQKLISSSVSRHLSTRNISSKSMHAFLSRVSTLTRDIDIAILSVRLSVCLSVRDVPLLDENGLTYCYSFSTIQ